MYKRQVVIIDYNIGNLSSVISALKRVGIEAVITRDKDIIRQAMKYSRNALHINILYHLKL